MSQTPSPADLYGGPGWSGDPRISNGPMVVGPAGQGMFPGLTGVWNPGWEGQGNDDSPFRRDAAVRGMVPGWELMESVTAGTDRLRQLAQWYLPQEQREDQDAWTARVETLDPLSLHHTPDRECGWCGAAAACADRRGAVLVKIFQKR